MCFYQPAAQMDMSECVLSAGRAVLDMVEREWQPLSPAELEQRLDQAVEEILEADLVTKLKTQPPPPPPPLQPPPSPAAPAAPIYVQLLQEQVLNTTTSSPAESRKQLETVDTAAAVQVNN